MTPESGSLTGPLRRKTVGLPTEETSRKELVRGPTPVRGVPVLSKDVDEDTGEEERGSRGRRFYGSGVCL